MNLISKLKRKRENEKHVNKEKLRVNELRKKLEEKFKNNTYKDIIEETVLDNKKLPFELK